MESKRSNTFGKSIPPCKCSYARHTPIHPRRSRRPHAIELRLCLGYDSRFRCLLREGKAARDAGAQISTKAGEIRHALLSLKPLMLAGEPHVLLMAQDITERLHLEAQLRQSQKMEAVGPLAVGSAHDFNNLLTIIQGHASLQIDGPSLTENIRSSLHEINGAAERAADLTRKLLTFSRRGMVRPKILGLNETILSLVKMLHRLLGEKTNLQTHLPTGLPNVFADTTSIEQIVMNLTHQRP